MDSICSQAPSPKQWVRNPSSVRAFSSVTGPGSGNVIVLQQNCGRSAFSVGKGPSLEALGVGMEVVMVWEDRS